ncbi:glycosyltransferase family 4 protein [Neobacillus mesonae]|nr:glycosyltransferase family 4 protein [Neobacillus mesonae]
MHIVMVCPEQFPLPGSGSVEICMLAIARELSIRHQVTLISRAAIHLPKETFVSHQLVIKRVPALNKAQYRVEVIKCIRTLEHVDIIQVDNRPRHMAAIKQAFPEKPVTLFLHSLTFVPSSKSISSMLHKADLVIANSRSLKRRLVSRFSLAPEQILTAPLGVDFQRFKPLSPEEKQYYMQIFGITKEHFNVLFVGRVIPQKGLPVLIRALHRIRPAVKARLIIAGNSKTQTYPAALRQLAKKLRVQLLFLGEVPHEQIHNLYPLANCIVCPSQKHEAFGLVNVEAMASGIPVIASRNGGIREIIEDGYDGFLIKNYQNALGFARRLTELAKNPDLARSMGANGRNKVQLHFTWQATASTLEAKYEHLISEHIVDERNALDSL